MLLSTLGISGRADLRKRLIAKYLASINLRHCIPAMGSRCAGSLIFNLIETKGFEMCGIAMIW